MSKLLEWIKEWDNRRVTRWSKWRSNAPAFWAWAAWAVAMLGVDIVRPAAKFTVFSLPLPFPFTVFPAFPVFPDDEDPTEVALSDRCLLRAGGSRNSKIADELIEWPSFNIWLISSAFFFSFSNRLPSDGNFIIRSTLIHSSIRRLKSS